MRTLTNWIKKTYNRFTKWVKRWWEKGEVNTIDDINKVLSEYGLAVCVEAERSEADNANEVSMDYDGKNEGVAAQSEHLFDDGPKQHSPEQPFDRLVPRIV